MALATCTKRITIHLRWSSGSAGSAKKERCFTVPRLLINYPCHLSENILLSAALVALDILLVYVFVLPCEAFLFALNVGFFFFVFLPCVIILCISSLALFLDFALMSSSTSTTGLRLTSPRPTKTILKREMTRGLCAFLVCFPSLFSFEIQHYLFPLYLCFVYFFMDNYLGGIVFSLLH